MNVLVVYESMYGNTHEVAESIATGLRSGTEAAVVPVAEATPELLRDADVLVVGGPTHVHGMARAATRKSAAEAADKAGSGLTLEPGAGPDDPGLREWLPTLHAGPGQAAAAFDTRMTGPVVFTGRASSKIAKRLRQDGYRMVADPASFLVDRQNRLVDGELDRAREWGEQLAAQL